MKSIETTLENTQLQLENSYYAPVNRQENNVKVEKLFP